MNELSIAAIALTLALALAACGSDEKNSTAELDNKVGIPVKGGTSEPEVAGDYNGDGKLGAGDAAAAASQAAAAEGIKPETPRSAEEKTKDIKDLCQFYRDIGAKCEVVDGQAVAEFSGK